MTSIKVLLLLVGSCWSLPQYGNPIQDESVALNVAQLPTQSYPSNAQPDRIYDWSTSAPLDSTVKPHYSQQYNGNQPLLGRSPPSKSSSTTSYHVDRYQKDHVDKASALAQRYGTNDATETPGTAYRHGNRFQAAETVIPGYPRPLQVNAESSSLDEDAKYDFQWAVSDDVTVNHFNHSETRDGQLTSGEYRTLLPDGRLQIVRYTVRGDEGYVAEVTYESTDMITSRSLGLTASDQLHGRSSPYSPEIRSHSGYEPTKPWSDTVIAPSAQWYEPEVGVWSDPIPASRLIPSSAPAKY